jgi:hypothetical protein
MIILTTKTYNLIKIGFQTQRFTIRRVLINYTNVTTDHFFSNSTIHYLFRIQLRVLIVLLHIVIDIFSNTKFYDDATMTFKISNI